MARTKDSVEHKFSAFCGQSPNEIYNQVQIKIKICSIEKNIVVCLK